MRLSMDWPRKGPRISSTPTMVTGMSPIFSVFPMGSTPSKNLSATSPPITATGAACSTSCGTRKRPLESVLFSISPILAVTPLTWVPNSSLPEYFVALDRAIPVLVGPFSLVGESIHHEVIDAEDLGNRGEDVDVEAADRG